MTFLEINPPHGVGLEKIITELKELNLNIDKYVITDNPLSRLRMDSILTAIKIQETFKKPVFATMSMRDKNKLSLQSSLLGANEFGITNILALTGDKAKKDEKGVNEGSSLLLLSIIDSFNKGKNHCGRELNPKPKNITAYAVMPSIYNSNTKKRMKKKIDFGAKGLITQPFFDLTNLKEFISDFNEIKEDEELIIGFFPFVSAKTVNYINDNIPGINVPKEIIDEMNLAFINETEYETGLKLSKKIYKEIKQIHPNIHIMSNNNFKLIKEIIS